MSRSGKNPNASSQLPGGFADELLAVNHGTVAGSDCTDLSLLDGPSTRALAAELCRASRLAQGLPAQVTDRSALVDIAVLVPVELDGQRCA